MSRHRKVRRMGTVQNVATQKKTVGERNIRLRKLRMAFGWSGEVVADRGGLPRTRVVKMEGGYDKMTSDKAISGLARAFGLTRDAMADYLDGKVTKEATLEASTAWGESSAKPASRRAGGE